MNIQKIEKLLSQLAKNGDKETINNVIELLTEVSSFKGSSSSKPKQVTEEYHQAPRQTEQKRFESPAARACAILDEAAASNFVPPPIEVKTYDVGPGSISYSQMANNTSVTSHASDLFI